MAYLSVPLPETAPHLKRIGKRCDHVWLYVDTGRKDDVFDTGDLDGWAGQAIRDRCEDTKVEVRSLHEEHGGALFWNGVTEFLAKCQLTANAQKPPEAKRWLSRVHAIHTRVCSSP
jgi:hypothetical protein